MSGGTFIFNDEGRCFVRGKTRYWPWARVVMEGHLGRVLAPDEVVHHINGDPTDDRLENLETLSPKEHMETHREMLSERLREKISKPRLSLVCPTCGTEFERLESRVSVYGQVYCSAECSYEGKRVTHCRYGHPRTPENTYTHKTNGRTECRTCMRIKQKVRQERRAAA